LWVPSDQKSADITTEGYSIGNDVLVIDVGNLNRLEIIDNHLYAEGGVNNKQLYDFISKEGYPFPGGTCPTVGLSGYASGGGWGLSCRLLGLGCDSLIELELVDAEGKLIKANSWKQELFWAFRGSARRKFRIMSL